MTYPPTPGPDGVRPPPPDPPIQAYQPPAPPPYGYGVQPYQAPPPQYDHGNPGSPYAYPGQFPPPRRPTEGLAVASLVVSCVGVLGLCLWSIGGLLGVVGAIFGHVARRRIRATGAGGDGLALAGIIVGWVVTGLAVIGAVIFTVVLLRDTGPRY